MSLTFDEAFSLSESWPFRHQVKAAAIKAALAIINENAETANHAARLQLAFAVIGDPHGWSIKLATACISTATGYAQIPPADADVAYTISDILWNPLSTAFVASQGG